MQGRVLPRISLLPRSTVRLNVNVIEGNPDRHILFLHGLFGKAQSFQFLAKSRLLQQQYTCHLVDLRNHGKSQWHAKINYESLAQDVHEYMILSGLASFKHRVSLVGHSLGGKTAIKIACLYPHLIDKLVSLDASPVNRLLYPHLNQSSQRLIQNAAKFGRPLRRHGLTRRQATKWINKNVSDEVLKQALLFNLADSGTFHCNLRAIYENQEDIYGFESEGTFEGQSLLINGAKSF